MKEPHANGDSAVDLIEEAVHLLRSAPLRFFAPYLAGAVPFSLGLLWFCAEMTWSSFASERLVDESLLVALLFLWKQVWEAVFCAAIHERIVGATESWTRQRVFRLVTTQLAVQPWSLIVLPVSLLTMLPFAWAIAFFRNLSLYAGSGSMHAVRLAREQAARWPRSNWILQAFLALLGLILLFNYFSAMVLIPQLGKSIFGLENALTRYPLWMLNSTGFVAVSLLVYLTLDPILCAVYVLRCFYGQSIHSGADLRARFRQITAKLALAVLLLLGPAGSHPAIAQTATAHATPALDAKQVDRSIQSVMRRREYTWRMPKVEDPARRPEWASWIDRAFARIGEYWDWFWEGIRRMFTSDGSGGAKSDGPIGVWDWALRYSLWILGAIFAVATAVLLYRHRNAQKRSGEVAAAAAAPVAVDLRDEALTADKLPESSWLSLAQDWIDKGDLRLALRAMHLAGLSYLNGRSLVTVQRWKSGMDYSAELARRARSMPRVSQAFRENLRIFEAGWYGRHVVDRDALEAFSRGLDEMRSHAERG